MQTLLRALCCLSCSLLVSVTPCLAALIEPLQGDCYISHGQGFAPVTGEMNAGPGDTVMVTPGGMAETVYSEGCKVDVTPGALMTIAASSPCGTPCPTCAPAQAVLAQPPASSFGPTLAGVGAVATAALAVSIYAIINNNNKGCGCTTPPPVSP